MPVTHRAGPQNCSATTDADELQGGGIEDPSLDAELLLAEAVGCDRAALVADREAAASPAAARLFGEMVRRRLRREPVAYILGRKGFRRIELAVDRRVLIPRPETELLVEVALEREPATVLDVGTGSGAIALAIADELPGCAVTATDTSAEALAVARANAERLGLGDRVRFQAGSVPAEGAFDLVVANLPYVAESEWALAAAGGGRVGAARGAPRRPRRTRCLPRLLRRAWSSFVPHTGRTSAAHLAVAVEVGEGQAAAVAGMMAPPASAIAGPLATSPGSSGW